MMYEKETVYSFKTKFSKVVMNCNGSNPLHINPRVVITNNGYEVGLFMDELEAIVGTIKRVQEENKS